MPVLDDTFSVFLQPGFLLSLAIILLFMAGFAGAMWWLTS
jgi:hypothetical protein